MFCLFVFGCQYQCNRLPPELKVRNYMLRVEWGVKPYSLTHLLCTNKSCLYFSNDKVRHLTQLTDSLQNV